MFSIISFGANCIRHTDGSSSPSIINNWTTPEAISLVTLGGGLSPGLRAGIGRLARIQKEWKGYYDLWKDHQKVFAYPGI